MSRTRANIIVSDNNTVYFWTSFKKTKNFKGKKFTINCTRRKDACQLFLYYNSHTFLWPWNSKIYFHLWTTFHKALVRCKKYYEKASIDRSILYSYLMCSQAIDQNIFPKVLGTLELFPVPRENYFGLLPGYTLNNCFIT
jgi:hypothetical protein